MPVFGSENILLYIYTSTYIFLQHKFSINCGCNLVSFTHYFMTCLMILKHLLCKNTRFLFDQIEYIRIKNIMQLIIHVIHFFFLKRVHHLKFPSTSVCFIMHSMIVRDFTKCRFLLALFDTFCGISDYVGDLVNTLQVQFFFYFYIIFF